MTNAELAILGGAAFAAFLVGRYLYGAWREGNRDWWAHARVIAPVIGTLIVLALLLSGPEVIALIGLPLLMGFFGVLLLWQRPPSVPRWLGWFVLVLAGGFLLQTVIRLTILS